MRLTLQEGSRRHQIRPEPRKGTNKIILSQPIPPPTNGHIPTMHNYPVDEIRKSTMKILHKATRLTKTGTPSQLKILPSNRESPPEQKDQEAPL